MVTDISGDAVYTDTFHINPCPGIIVQPVDYKGEVGTRTTFTIEAKGNGLAYQWQYKEKSGTTWNDCSGASAKTANWMLTVAAVHYGFDFRCVVTDSEEKSVTSDIFHVIKPEELGIITQPVDFKGAVGDQAAFQIEAKGEGLTYQWQYKEKNGNTWNNCSGASAKSANYKLTVAKVHYYLDFKCVVTDSKGNSVSSDIVHIVKPEELGIITQPIDLKGAIGDQATFMIEAKGEGLTYQWQYKEKTGNTWNNCSGASAKTADYKLTVAKVHYYLDFKCVVTDSKENSVSSDIVHIIKPEELGIITQPMDYIGAKVGSQAAFSIEARGDGLTYQWQYKEKNSDIWKNASGASAKTANYILTVAKVHYGLDFRCSVTDSDGNSVVSDIVYIKPEELEILVQPTDCFGMAVGDKATFTVGAKGEELAYQWQYKEKTAASWNNSSGTSAKTASWTLTVAELHYGFDFRCVITDIQGNSITSEIVHISDFEELEIVTQPEDYNGKIGSKATFTIEAKGENLTYQWQYKEKISDTWNNSNGASAKTDRWILTVAELHYDFDFRCEVTDGTGEKTYSDVVHINPAFAITLQPENYSKDIGEVVDFTIEARGEGLTYQWQYKEKTSDNWKNSNGVSAKTSNWMLTVAKVHYDFDFRCVVTDSGNEIIYSDIVHIDPPSEGRYTIVYDAGSGSFNGIPDLHTVTVDVEPGIIFVDDYAEPEWPGHEFLGWGDANGNYIRRANITADTTFYALWTDMVNVTYDANGGHFSDGSDLFVDENMDPGIYYVSAYLRPEREGYLFKGWYTSAEGGTCTGTVTLTESMTLYAHWDPALTITYDADGGYWWSYDKEGNEEKVYTRSDYIEGGYYWVGIAEPEREGFEFDGWTVNGQKVNRIYVTQNITVKAKWRKMAEITFDPNGGYWWRYDYEEDENVPDYDNRYAWEPIGDVYDPDAFGYVPTKDPEGNMEYEFVGWSTDPDAVDRPDNYTVELTEDIGDITFYAIYMPSRSIQVTVKYDPNGGEIYDETGVNEEDHWITGPRVDEEHAGRYWILNYGLRRDCYEHIGWATSKTRADQGIVDYKVSDKLVLSGDTTFYAVWHKLPTITYHGNGYKWKEEKWDRENGEYVTVERSEMFHWEEPGTVYYVGCWIDGRYSVTLDNGSVVSYEFDGWFDSAVGGNRVDDEELVLKEGDDIHYYAHWRKQITVTYVTSIGGYGEFDEETGEYERNSIVRSDVWTGSYNLDGWTPYDYYNVYGFVGYSLSPNSTEAEYQPEQTIEIPIDADSFTLYAVWKKNPVIHFYGNGGVWHDDYTNIDLKVRDSYKTDGRVAYIRNDEPSYEGYAFRGWLDEDGNDRTDEPVRLNYGDEITVYASWVKVVTVAYDAGIGEFYDEGGWPSYDVEKGETSKLHLREAVADDENWFDGWRPQYFEQIDLGDGTTRFVEYEFIGWSLDPNAGFNPGAEDPFAGLILERNDSPMLTDYSVFTMLDPEGEDESFITLYAVYAPPLTIRYDANGGGWGWTWDQDHYDHCEESVREHIHRYREGEFHIGEDWPYRYELVGNGNDSAGKWNELNFIGWSLDKNDTQPLYDWDITLEELAQVEGFAETGTVTVYAIWDEPVGIPVDFAGGVIVNESSGTPVPEYGTNIYYSNGVFVDKWAIEDYFEPEKEGYRLIGWSVIEKDGNGNIVSSIPLYDGFRVKPGISIRAEYIKIHEVCLDCDGGELYDDTSYSMEYSHGSILDLRWTDEPVKPGYAFLGWFDLNGNNILRTVVTDDMMLVAGWIEDPDRADEFYPSEGSIVVFAGQEKRIKIYYPGEHRDLIPSSNSTTIAHAYCSQKDNSVVIAGESGGTDTFTFTDPNGNTCTVEVRVIECQFRFDRSNGDVYADESGYLITKGDPINDSMEVEIDSYTVIYADMGSEDDLPYYYWHVENNNVIDIDDSDENYAGFDAYNEGMTRIGIEMDGVGYCSIEVYVLGEDDDEEEDDEDVCPECESPYDYHFRGCSEYEYVDGECGECGGRYGDHADWCASHGEAI